MSKFSKLVKKQKEKQEVKKSKFNLEAKVNSNRIKEINIEIKKSEMR